MGQADFLRVGDYNKQCNKCLEVKPLEEFYKLAHGHKGVFGQCIVCHNSRAKELRKLKGKEYHSQRAKKYLDLNPQARERARIRNQDWRKNNLAYDAFRASMRRQAIKQATPNWADFDEIQMIYEKASYFGFEVDHVVPIKSKLVCGLNVPANMQLLHKSLNASKGNRYWPDMPERSK
jgi:hypothetical protein